MLIHLSQENGTALIKPKAFLGREAFNTFRMAIEGSRFDFARKLNVATLDKVPTIIKRLRDNGFGIECDSTLVDSLKNFTQQQWLDLQSAKDRLDSIDEELKKLGEKRGKKMALYGFQRVGVQWLATRSGALLGDDMGLGKTLQTLASLPANVPILVICPAVAKGVWRREVNQWRPHIPVEVLQGRGSFRWPEKGELVATNYDILPDGHKKECNDKLCKGCASFLSKTPENLIVIADEAHVLKSSKAKRTMSFRAIGHAARQRSGRTWLLTATPLLNRPPELWSVLMAAGLSEEAFGSWNTFIELFKAKKKPFGGWEWGTPDPSVEERIRRVMLRRVKSEVATDLPKKSYKIVDVEIDHKTLELCDEVLEGVNTDNIEALLDEHKSKIPFEKMSEVRVALSTAKIPALLDVVSEYEEAQEPVVVFSAHRGPIDMLGKREGWKTITGDTSPGDRTAHTEAFQEGHLKGIACTIDAGGVAITLTRACNAIFCDLKWTPGLNSQAEDRICRIGQTRPCTITILTANHKLDERVNALLMKKQSLIDASVEAARDTPDHERETDPTTIPKDLKQQNDLETKLMAEAEAVAKSSVPDVAPTVVQKKKYRVPNGAREAWAAESLIILDDANPDMAGTLNSVGFNKIDGPFGKSLRRQLDLQGGLSDAQWKSAIQLLKKYHRQVGRCPEEDE